MRLWAALRAAANIIAAHRHRRWIVVDGFLEVREILGSGQVITSLGRHHPFPTVPMETAKEL
jgi:hypothetical protein